MPASELLLILADGAMRKKRKKFHLALRVNDHQRHLCTYDEETCTDHDRLHLDVQVHGELDPEVVRIGERLPEKSGPLLADFADLARLVHRQDLHTREKRVDTSHCVHFPLPPMT